MKEKLLKKKYEIVTAFFLLVQLAFSLRFMGRQYFSLDEVSQIGFISKKVGFSGLFRYYLTSEITNLPAFPLLAGIWYRLVPYGEGYMRLLTVLLTTGAILVLIKGARDLGGKESGLIMAFLSCSSSVIMQKCGLTFRCHGFWLLFTALVLWQYILRFRENEDLSTKRVVTLGLSMMGLAWSHFFGCLVIVYLFLMDSFLFLKKRMGGRYIISYLMAGLSLLPWEIAVILHKTMDLSDFWPQTPTFESIPEALLFTVSYDRELFYILLAAMIFFLALSLRRILLSRPDYNEGFLMLGLAWMPLIFAVGDYIYSAHINVRSGLFVYRYFLAVLPAALLTVTVFSGKLLGKLAEALHISGGLLIISAAVFGFVLLGAPNYYKDVKDEISAPYDNTYGNVRDAVMENGDAYSEGTLLAINANRANADGFEEYYMNRGGRAEEKIAVMSNEDPDMAERISKAQVVYIYQVMKGEPDVFTDLMGEDFVLISHDENIGLYRYERQ